jgi:triphosphoribosyl-dephospho-CoA synthase
VRSTAENAQLALLLEVAGTPKPGNVDRHREYDDLRFEHFLAGAVGARPGLASAADERPLGEAFLEAVEGMSEQSGGNTQFGAILLQLPLVAAAGAGSLTREAAARAARETTVSDAVAFYESFEVVDVAVPDPPEGLELLDVRRGSDAARTIEERGLTLYDVMERSADVDGVAREWVGGFERTFDAAESIRAGDGPVTDRAAETFLELLAAQPDTFVAKRHGRETAETVTERARAALGGAASVEDLADDLVARGINPGTTADVVAGGLFVALERGTGV